MVWVMVWSVGDEFIRILRLGYDQHLYFFLSIHMFSPNLACCAWWSQPHHCGVDVLSSHRQHCLRILHIRAFFRWLKEVFDGWRLVAMALRMRLDVMMSKRSQLLSSSKTQIKKSKNLKSVPQEKGVGFKIQLHITTRFKNWSQSGDVWGDQPFSDHAVFTPPVQINSSSEWKTRTGMII